MSHLLSEALVLHHYDFSNFAEKIRLIFGLKGLAWHSVITPMVLPKPELTQLTGGYRKIPVLQIGADIYCDTSRIALELERLFPEPSLFPGKTQGTALAIAGWAERTLLWPTARYATGAIADRLPIEFHADRAEMWGVPLNISRYKAASPRHKAQMIALLGIVDSMLASSGGPFLLGKLISLADVSVYHPLWLVEQCDPALMAPFDAFPRLISWLDRIRMIGHGTRSKLDAGSALDIARGCLPKTAPAIATIDGLNFLADEPVIVRPMDYGQDRVSGTLHRLTLEDIAIKRTEPSLNEVVINFPFPGYRLQHDR